MAATLLHIQKIPCSNLDSYSGQKAWTNSEEARVLTHNRYLSFVETYCLEGNTSTLKWVQHVPKKISSYLPKLHGVIFQKTATFLVTGMPNFNPHENYIHFRPNNRR
jgi:hypothetical protein